MDDLGQNVVFYIIPGCNIDLENDQLIEQIQTSHIEIAKGIINTSDHFKYMFNNSKHGYTINSIDNFIRDCNYKP